MEQFRQHIFETCKEAISKWDKNEDIYALGLLTLNDEDDFRKPTLRLVYNTKSQVKLKFPASLKVDNNNKWGGCH